MISGRYRNFIGFLAGILWLFRHMTPVYRKFPKISLSFNCFPEPGYDFPRNSEIPPHEIDALISDPSAHRNGCHDRADKHGNYSYDALFHAPLK